MSSHKRRASGCDVEPAAKSARTENTEHQPNEVHDLLVSPSLPLNHDAQQTQNPSRLSEDLGSIKIVVKVSSTSKAIRNDPELTFQQRELYKKKISELSNVLPPSFMDGVEAYRAARELGSGKERADPNDEEHTTLEVSGLQGIGTTQEAAAVAADTAEDREASKNCPDHHSIVANDENDSYINLADEGTYDDESSQDESDEDCYDDDFDDDTNEDSNDGDDRSENDPDFEFKWLEPIKVEAFSTHIIGGVEQATRVAYCSAKLIRRGQMREDFHGEMEQPSDETCMLAFDLFDRYGRLRTEYKEHPIIKGSGIWNKELDHGDMLLIEELFVSQNYRRQGLGRKLIESLLDRVRQKTRSFFAFVWPTLLKLGDIEHEWKNLETDDERQQMEDRETTRAVAFYRSLAFRRIGNTIWFAMASNDSHPSRQLEPCNDIDLPRTPSTAMHPHLRLFQEITDPPKRTWSQIFGREPVEKPDLLGALQNCMEQMGPYDACWTSQDRFGNTVLHSAALAFSEPCIEWILKQEFGDRLRESRNRRGETPLESLQFKMEEIRTRKAVNMLTVPMSDKFHGHGVEALRCMVLLKSGVSAEAFTESKGMKALLCQIGGCTCEACLDGFLSPRMSHLLVCQAQISYDMMDSNIGDMSGPEWVEDWETYLGYLPGRVEQNLKTNKSMRQGFVNLWKYVAECLERKWTPTEQHVLEIAREAGEWPPVTKNFFQRGGTVESVFLAICRRALETNRWTGDGDYEETFEEEIAKLPECRNDHEFGFVSGMCKYRRISLATHITMMGHVTDEDGKRVESRW